MPWSCLLHSDSCPMPFSLWSIVYFIYIYIYQNPMYMKMFLKIHVSTQWMGLNKWPPKFTPHPTPSTDNTLILIWNIVAIFGPIFNVVIINLTIKVIFTQHLGPIYNKNKVLSQFFFYKTFHPILDCNVW